MISVAIMSQGRLLRSPCFHLLLVALAIQGITPDAQDLASIQTLRLFSPFFSDFSTSAQLDEWPDDVCDLAQTGTSFLISQRQVRDESPIDVLAMTGIQLRAIDPASIRFAARRGGLASITDVIGSQVRMIC